MQPALDALDRGVQQLFARPARRRSHHHQQQQHRHHTPQHSPLTPSGSTSTRPQHPLCECLALQPLPDDWHHLRRHPVLKRHVLSRWQELCDQYVGDKALQQQQYVEHQQDRLVTPVSITYARQRAIVVQSVNALSVLFYQCGLLHVREIEFVRLVVAKTLAHGLGDVLLLVRENRQTSELPLRVRMLLLHVVLEHVALVANYQNNSSNNITNKRELQGSLDASQRLIEDVCTSLQEEVLEALTNKRARGKAKAVGATPSRTNASPGGTRKAERREPVRSAFAPVCEFCGQSDEPLDVSSTPWIELQRLSSTVQKVLGGVENEELFPDENKSATVSKLVSLRNLLARSDVKLRLATRACAQIQLQSNSQLYGGTLQHRWALSVTRYKQIRWSTISNPRALVQNESAAALDANVVLWGNVWERELQRFAPAKHVCVSEVVGHCAKVDSFIRIPSLSTINSNNVKFRRSNSSDSTASLPGYRLVCQVLRALQIDGFTAILLFLQAWSSITALGTLSAIGSHHHSRIQESSTTITTKVSNSVAAVCRSYLEQLLSDSERQVWLEAEDNSPATRLQVNKKGIAKTPVGGEQLVELLHSLYAIFADALVCDDAGDGSQRPPYCRHWDRILLLPRPMDGSTVSGAHSAGLSWLNALKLCCKQLYANDTSDKASSFQQHGAFKTVFASYLQRIICAIVADNGQSISSGAGSGYSFREPLVCTEEDLQFVREAMTSILVSVSEGRERQGSHWVSGLIVQLLQTQMHHRSRAWSVELSLTYRRGLDQLFFPALASCIKALCTNQHSDSQAQGRVKASEAEEDQFFVILSQVVEGLQAHHGSHAVTTLLLGFCTDWDAYQLKATSNIRGRRRPLRRLWGRASVLKLHVFVNILQIYESESALANDRGEVLQFLGDVLQSVTNCPSALEGKLFHVLSRIKNRLENRHPINCGGGGGGSHVPPTGSDPQEDELPTPVLIHGTSVNQIGPISHSSDPLAKFMYQLHTETILQVREAVEKLKSDSVALEDLVQHVSRWIALMQLNDPRAAFGKETKLSFVVLCNRLMCWLPNEMIHEIRQAVTPVDQDLVYALTAFAGNYGFHHEDEHTMGMSMGSSVRLELLIRSFVYSFVVPDLCELTDVVMNAIISCTSTKSRDALMKTTQRISSVLLVEVAIETLRLSLSTECLSYLDRISQQDDHHQQMSDEGDDSVNRLSNTLSIVGLSSALFNCHDISWSASLFDEQAVQHWLLCFFDCMVYSEQSRALTPVDELLSSLEFLMQQSPNGERMAKHSYLLVALLCTASFSQSRIPQALWSDFDTSLLEITQAILAVLSPPKVSDDGVAQEDNECEVLFVQVDPLRVARAKVSEEKVELGSELPGDARGSTVLTKRLQNGYMDEQEPDDQVDSGGVRVFVRFNTWLASAIIYSQSIAAALTTNNNGGGEENSWEQVFADYVVYLYLPLEFGNSVSRLLDAWVSVWMRTNLEQQLAAGENGDALSQLLLLLPFQQKLFSRLSATRPPQRSEDPSSAADPVWRLVFTSARKILESISNAPDAIDAAIIVLDDVIEKFDLVNLSTMTASGGGGRAFVQSEPLAHEFNALCSHQSLALLSDVQTIHVLKYPLELVAFCHITILKSDETPGFVTLPVSSQQWDLERVLTALGLSIHTQGEDSSSPSSSPETENGQDTTVKLSEEMSAFWYEWTQMIQLKYAYLDPTQCEQFVLAATQAVSGQVLAQP